MFAEMCYAHASLQQHSGASANRLALAHFVQQSLRIPQNSNHLLSDMNVMSGLAVASCQLRPFFNSL